MQEREHTYTVFAGILMLMILRTNASTPETEEDIVQNPWACLEATNV